MKEFNSLNDSNACLELIERYEFKTLHGFYTDDNKIDFYKDILNGSYKKNLNNYNFYNALYFIKENDTNKIFNILNQDITDKLRLEEKTYIKNKLKKVFNGYYVINWFKHEQIFLKKLIKDEIKNNNYEIFNFYKKKLSKENKKHFFYLKKIYEDECPNLVFKFYFYKKFIENPRNLNVKTDSNEYRKFYNEIETFRNLMIKFFLKDFYEILIEPDHFYLLLKDKPDDKHLPILKDIFAKINDSLDTDKKFGDIFNSDKYIEILESLILYKHDKVVFKSYGENNIPVTKYYLYFIYLALFFDNKPLIIYTKRDDEIKTLYFYYNDEYNSMYDNKIKFKLQYSKPYLTLNEITEIMSINKSKKIITIYI